MTPSQTQVRTHTCTRSRNLPWLQSVCKQRRLVAQQQRHELMGEVETQPSGSALHHCVSALIRGLPGWAVGMLLACMSLMRTRHKNGNKTGTVLGIRVECDCVPPSVCVNLIRLCVGIHARLWWSGSDHNYTKTLFGTSLIVCSLTRSCARAGSPCQGTVSLMCNQSLSHVVIKNNIHVFTIPWVGTDHSSCWQEKNTEEWRF